MQRTYQRLKRHKQAQVRRLKRWRKHPFLYPVLLFVGLALVTGSAGYYLTKAGDDQAPSAAAHIAIINVDHTSRTVPTSATTVGQLLKRADVQLGKGDVVEPSASTEIDQDNFRINVYRAVPLTIDDGNTVMTTLTAAATPRAMAAQAGVKLYPEDRLSVVASDKLISTNSLGQRLVIDRSVPLTLTVYGTPLAIRTHTDTVRELLAAKNIKLAKDDSVVPSLDSRVTPDMQVYVNRKGTTVQTVNQDIAMPVQTINDPTLAYGTTAVRQAGSPGTQVLTYQINLQNGVEVSRSLLQSVTTVAPVTQVVVMGTNLSGIKGDMALAGIAPSDYTYADYIISHESGWRPNASNPSGAYGLCQALPGSKMASAGADWATNPITQLKWCSNYANKYGGWAGAYNFWLSHHYW